MVNNLQTVNESQQLILDYIIKSQIHIDYSYLVFAAAANNNL